MREMTSARHGIFPVEIRGIFKANIFENRMSDFDDYRTYNPLILCVDMCEIQAKNVSDQFLTSKSFGMSGNHQCRGVDIRCCG